MKFSNSTMKLRTDHRLLDYWSMSLCMCGKVEEAEKIFEDYERTFPGPNCMQLRDDDCKAL
ncbi:hypothetical protein CFP56_028182 [Quercus suber]|uniref:Uncharacterized protein n=1 Tax=Quercus suber TaxID=58331 RepID=A0AAW0JW41_QUESU